MSRVMQTINDSEKIELLRIRLSMGQCSILKSILISRYDSTNQRGFSDHVFSLSVCKLDEKPRSIC